MKRQLSKEAHSQALFMAAVYSDDELRDLLNKCCCDLESFIDDNKNTILHWSAKKGYSLLVKLLIDSGMNPESINNSDENALAIAAANGHFQLVEYLLSKGCVSEIGKALLLAAEGGHTEIVEWLIEKGADVNFRDVNRDTPLIMAAKSGFYDTVVKLLSHGADPDAYDMAGNTSLIIASFREYPEIVGELIKAGSKVNYKNDEEDSALHMAAYKANEAIAQILINNGAHVNAKDKLGNTPLSEAVAANSQVMVDLLIDNGASLWPGMTGPNPLSSAAANGFYEVLTSLLKIGKEHLDDATEIGYTPLIYAIIKGHTPCVDLLLKHGANVNVVCGADQSTPLMMAIMKSPTAIEMVMVKKLLAAGADVNRVNSQKENALYIAGEQGLYTTCEVIAKAMKKQNSEPVSLSL